MAGSFIEPGAPLPREVVKYIDYDLKRFAVIYGCTGLRQISGRNEIAFSEMVALDIH